MLSQPLMMNLQSEVIATELTDLLPDPQVLSSVCNSMFQTRIVESDEPLTMYLLSELISIEFIVSVWSGGSLNSSLRFWIFQILIVLSSEALTMNLPFGLITIEVSLHLRWPVSMR